MLVIISVAFDSCEPLFDDENDDNKIPLKNERKVRHYANALCAAHAITH
jgi:hypothetical protein